MIVKYNSLNRLEKPKLTLCNPGSIYNDGTLTKTVGILTDHEAEEVVLNFNATSQLSFRVNRVHRDDNEENLYTYTLYKAIQNRRLIFVDDIGFFMITSVEDGYNNSTHYKDVKAQSIDIEIQQKNIPYIQNGTYRFKTRLNGTDKGIFNTIIECLPLWTIGYIDSSIAAKYRTFEDIDTNLNCLSFLLNNIQDAYECIILFDTINRVVNVYDQANYVKKTGIHISKDDLINSIDISENTDNLYTAISVLGNEDTTISSISPLGTNTIYNFDYYIGWMSSELRTKVANWKTAVEAAEDTYYQTNLLYYQKLEEESNIQLEIERIETQIEMYRRCRNNIVAESSTHLVSDYNTSIVANGGTPIEIHEQISETLNEIDTLISSCESEKDDLADELSGVDELLSQYRSAIESVHDSLSLDSYFTLEEYSELCNYIYEGSYTDEYVVITDSMSFTEKFAQMKILYDRAKIQLTKASSPSQEFSIDVDNFIFSKEFEHWSNQLETGCLINVELEQDDIALLFLSSITINFDDHKLSLTFGNRYNKFDTKALFDKVLGKISKSANTLNYIKDLLLPIKNGEINRIKESLQSSRDITMNSALTSTSEEVIIDGSGYTGRRTLDSGEYDPRQVKIVGKNIVFTDDAWETCKVAIGELLFGEDGETAYGVNAETIIGDIIMGNNLRIVDSNGNDLLTVIDGKISLQVDAVDGRVSTLEQSADSIDMRVQSLESTNGEVDHVITASGYTFDSDGLSIYKDGQEIKNLLDNTGMYVTRSDEEILTANNDGVSAINLSSRQYLTMGANSRFEDYSNGTDTNRTACFYIGI